jgi:hypothetical protein
MERFTTEWRWRMRSRDVRILVVENFVLKKKRECEGEEEGAPVKRYI